MKFDDFLKRGWLYQATGYTVLISFLVVQGAIIWVDVPEKNRELFHLLIGIIDTAFVGNLVNHFYGSSNSRKEKDENITQ